jgi:hypothetical protein
MLIGNSDRSPSVHDGEEGGLPMFDLHRLRLLRELKHRGTLAAVATALSYAPSSVSQQLSQLETEVACRSSNRSDGGCG